MSDWIAAVEEHKETIQQIANADLPLSEDMEQLLDEYESEING